MSPLTRGPPLGPRVSPGGIRPPPPRFGARLPPPGMPPRMPPPPMSPVFGPMRQRLPPPPRPGGVARPNGPMPLFRPRGRGMVPMVPPVGMRAAGPRGPMMRPWPRRALPPQILQPMRPRFAMGNGNAKGKVMTNLKKVSKLEELELKKPWMTDEIRSEIQKKNRLYAKAKKNKDAKEWEEFKDLRNKVTRMIRDAKNEYLAKHPEQAHLYQEEEEPYDQRDENYTSSEDDVSYYCEVCDREFATEDLLRDHKKEHKLCGIDGCTFSAHPLLVQKHISMQHSTGLYQRMKNLSTPEDIEKWLVERKKRYPTKANIELKKAEEQEKIQRGEVIKEDRDLAKRKIKKAANARDRRRKRSGRMKQLSDNIPLTKKYRGILAFPGTAILNESQDEESTICEEVVETRPLDETVHDIYDEENAIVPNTDDVETIRESDFIGVVPSLVANYGSDSDESDSPLSAPIDKIEVDEGEHKVVDIPVNLERVPENSVNTEKHVAKVLRKNTPLNESQGKHQLHQKHATQGEIKRKEKVSTNKRSERHQLLYRLLSRSIQHERNLICQCIKFITDNNFFD